MLTTITPRSPILQKHIECFYVLSSDTPADLSYLAFPHYNICLSFFRGINIERSTLQVDISGNGDSNVHIELLGKYFNPVRVQYRGTVQEVAIIFKPLGISRFIRDTYLSIAPGFSQEFGDLKWKLFGDKLFKENMDLNELEEFLLSEFEETDELAKLEKSLPFLHQGDLELSISEIAENSGYNLKTFQRHFTKHMGCSPVDYRRIIRFRNSIDSKLNVKELKSLTDIGFENNYFDQSHFIREFRRLTNRNPKSFFKAVSQLDGEKIVWEIL